MNLEMASRPFPGNAERDPRPWRDFPVGSKAKAPSSAPLILVADDDPRIRTVLARLLRLEGYEVVLEEDGKGALEAVPLLRPDLILLDVMMPGMNGEKVCQALKADPETRLVPILLLSGLMDVQDRVRGLEAGADDFLSKPPDRLELLARVRALLRQKSYTDRLVSAESVVLSLARSIEGKDPYTEGHCERLACYGSQLAVHMGLEPWLVEAVSHGGILHDIGKVAVPDAVLLKEGPLTDEEWVLMKKHPLTGEHICGPVHSFRDVLPIIRHHHEKWDGSGYPDGLRGEEIPLSAPGATGGGHLRCPDDRSTLQTGPGPSGRPEHDVGGGGAGMVGPRMLLGLRGHGTGQPPVVSGARRTRFGGLPHLPLRPGEDGRSTFPDRSTP